MSTRKVDASGFSEALAAELKKYAAATAEEIKESANTAAKYCLAEVKSNISEAGIGKGAKGDYARSWKVKKTSENATGIVYTIYSTKPGLPHLLENGHVIKNQTGKVIGKRAPARPHIGPAERDAAAYFEKLVKKEVKG